VRPRHDGLLGSALWKQGSRAGEGESRERRERVEIEGREKRVWAGFDSKNFKISNGHVKNFQHEICRKSRTSQLSFQAKTHLKRR